MRCLKTFALLYSIPSYYFLRRSVCFFSFTKCRHLSAMSGRRSGSFLGNIVCNIASKERQPKEGLVQILDIPSNLSQLDLSSIAGLQVPIYDGIFFCHAFFKKRAKAELMLFLQSNYPSSVYSAPWRSKPKAKTFAKSPEFSTECPAAMEEDNVIFCNITVGDRSF